MTSPSVLQVLSLVYLPSYFNEGSWQVLRPNNAGDDKDSVIF